jgi:hypothetical protein
MPDFPGGQQVPIQAHRHRQPLAHSCAFARARLGTPRDRISALNIAALYAKLVPTSGLILLAL